MKTPNVCMQINEIKKPDSENKCVYMDRYSSRQATTSCWIKRRCLLDCI